MTAKRRRVGSRAVGTPTRRELVGQPSKTGRRPPTVQAAEDQSDLRVSRRRLRDTSPGARIRWEQAKAELAELG